MSAVKQWYSAAELAEMKISGLPLSKKGMIDFANREGWSSRKREGRGGGIEYQPPKSIMQIIQQRSLTALLQSSPKVAIAEVKDLTSNFLKNNPLQLKPNFESNVIQIAGLTRRVKGEEDLTDKDRARRDGALVICRAIDDAKQATHCSTKRAIVEMTRHLMQGIASPELVHAANITYTKPRKTGQTEAALISRLQKMYAAFEQGRLSGDVGRYLVAGSRQKEGHSPLMIKAFLLHFCRPSRPPVMEAWKNSLAWFEHHGLQRPAVDTFYRIEKELPVTIKYRGRVTGSEWRSLLPYVKRDVSMFKANDIWVGDGHSFKAKVQSPLHGRPFIPEVTFVRDWVSRKIVGWSIDLAESTIAVSASLRNAMKTTNARPLVYYSDNGSGQTAKFLDHEVHGTLARLGIAHETGIPGNPQGRGIIERLWADTLIPLARSYPTFQGKSGDSEAIRKILVDLNKKEPKTLLPSFAQLMEDVPKVVDEYNNRPHSALSGSTPNQVYAQKLDPDSLDIGMQEDELFSLWMPEVQRIPQRGLVSLFNNEYALPEMVNLLAEGEQVRVRFDIHDASQVTLLRMDGRYLGVAEWDGHKRAAFPVPFMEMKREERVERKVAKKEKEIAQARQELGNTIEGEKLTVFQFPETTKEPELINFEFPEKEEKKETSFMDTVQFLYGNKPEEPPKNEKAAY